MQIAKFWIFFFFVLLMIHVFRSVPLFIETYAQHSSTQKSEMWRKLQCNDKTFLNNMRSLNSDFCDFMLWQTESILQQSSFWVALQACVPFKDEVNVLMTYSFPPKICVSCVYSKLALSCVFVFLLFFILATVLFSNPQWVQRLGTEWKHAMHRCKCFLKNSGYCFFQSNRHPTTTRSGRLNRIQEHEDEDVSSYYQCMNYDDYLDTGKPIRYRPMYRAPPPPPHLRRRIEN